MISDGSGPSPQISALDGKRFIMVSEFNDRDKIDEEILKELTGGEGISGRGHQENERNISGDFMVWLFTNKLPKLSFSKSIVRRLFCIPFDATFVENEDEVEESQNIYLLDPSIEKRFKQTNYLSTLFWIIIERSYQNIFKPPKWAKQIADGLKSENDKLTDWINLHYTPDLSIRGKKKIPLEEVWQRYLQSCKLRKVKLDFEELTFKRKMAIIYKPYRCEDDSVIFYRFWDGEAEELNGGNDD